MSSVAGGDGSAESHQRPAAKSKGKAASNAVKGCHISGCPNGHVHKQPFCEHHQKVVQAIRGESKKAGKNGEVEKLLKDPVAAAKFCHDFQAFKAVARSSSS